MFLGIDIFKSSEPRASLQTDAQCHAQLPLKYNSSIIQLLTVATFSSTLNIIFEAYTQTYCGAPTGVCACLKNISNMV